MRTPLATSPTHCFRGAGLTAVSYRLKLLRQRFRIGSTLDVVNIFYRSSRLLTRQPSG